MAEFIKIKCGSYKIVHGFDSENREIVETVDVPDWTEKIVAVNRIQSVTENYIRMAYSHDRIIYWKYQGGLKDLERLLAPAVL
jgi:hypothetical protein